MSNTDKCKFTPDWCKAMKTIPKAECLPEYSINKLPHNVPLSPYLAIENLRESYGFTEASQRIIWRVALINWDAPSASEQEELLEGAFCQQDVSTTISANGVSGVYLTLIPNFYPEDPESAISTEWLIKPGELCCDGDDTTGRCITLGPAPQPVVPAPILPTPSFVPHTGGAAGVDIDWSLANLMRKNKSGALEASPTNFSCDEFHPVLTLKWAENEDEDDPDKKYTPYVAWDCLPQTSGGCTCTGMLMKLVEVPRYGYGAATARIIVKLEDGGTPVYGDTVVVSVPKLF